ncbi:MAG: tetratricopeptide repeat protein [Verrucomicrobia bacterium]|nr:MAG: tetratricopeptide repeat protein [Verrucomicrobiota bacterium]
MDPLTHADKLQLEAAEGWLLLGDARQALAELDQLRPEVQDHLAVLELRWNASAQLADWTGAYNTAQRILEHWPDEVFGWIHRAFALRRMPGGGLERARDALLPAADKFPEEFLVPYNLACYEAVLGRLDTAWQWLTKAMRLAGRDRILKLALADEDLVALRDRLVRPEGKA